MLLIAANYNNRCNIVFYFSFYFDPITRYHWSETKVLMKYNIY